LQEEIRFERKDGRKMNTLFLTLANKSPFVAGRDSFWAKRRPKSPFVAGRDSFWADGPNEKALDRVTKKSAVIHGLRK
jgi:hypothetical protein